MYYEYQMKNSQVTNTVLDFSGGLLVSLSDLLLYSVYLFGSSFGQPNSSYGVNRAFAEANEMLAQFNTRSIISLLKGLNSRHKYIRIDRSNNNPNISLTEDGMDHLEEVVPLFKTDRQ